MSKEKSDLEFNLSHWNYRIVRHKIAGGEYYRVHEVYYDADGEPAIIAEEPQAAFGETPDELIAELELSPRYLGVSHWTAVDACCF
jgi:hypothetical protein